MNKKNHMVVIFIILFVFNLYSDIMVGPKKNKDVGVVIGQIYMYLDKEWVDLSPGKYYDIDVYVENIVTKKKYKTVRYDKGYFCLLNLPPGQYKLSKLDFFYEKYSTLYYFIDFKVYSIDSDGKVSDQGIKFSIHKDTITTLKTIFVYVKLMPNDKFIPAFKREGDLEHLKKFFKSIDTKNKWSHFDFVELELK
ncbi:MAG: hypothetical protein JXB50_10600 [Spirochaetes bacterium]|nr:hypothetical protein [Spirochaetota bacterium]